MLDLQQTRLFRVGNLRKTQLDDELHCTRTPPVVRVSLAPVPDVQDVDLFPFTVRTGPGAVVVGVLEPPSAVAVALAGYPAGRAAAVALAFGVLGTRQERDAAAAALAFADTVADGRTHGILLPVGTVGVWNYSGETGLRGEGKDVRQRREETSEMSDEGILWSRQNHWKSITGPHPHCCLLPVSTSKYGACLLHRSTAPPSDRSAVAQEHNSQNQA